MTIEGNTPTVSFQRYQAMVKRLCLLMQLQQYQPELIVALSRGGFHPAADLATHLGVRRLIGVEVVQTPDGRSLGDTASLGDLSGLQVLIVDDSTITGRLFYLLSQEVSARGGVPRTCAPIGVGRPHGDFIAEFWDFMPKFYWEMPLL